MEAELKAPTVQKEGNGTGRHEGKSSVKAELSPVHTIVPSLKWMSKYGACRTEEETSLPCVRYFTVACRVCAPVDTPLPAGLKG